MNCGSLFLFDGLTKKTQQIARVGNGRFMHFIGTKNLKSLLGITSNILSVLHQMVELCKLSEQKFALLHISCSVTKQVLFVLRNILRNCHISTILEVGTYLFARKICTKQKLRSLYCAHPFKKLH